MPPSHSLSLTDMGPALRPPRAADRALLGLKPLRDHPANRKAANGRDKRPGKSVRQVPSSPLAHNVMTFRSSSSSSHPHVSPLHRIAHGKIKKASGSSRQSSQYSSIRIGKLPRKVPRPKYQGSPVNTSPVQVVATKGAAGPSNTRPIHRLKVLEKPKTQPIFKKTLVDKLTQQLGGPTLKTKVAEKILADPGSVSAGLPVSHPSVQSTLKPNRVAVPTSPVTTKSTFIQAWVASQIGYAKARADRLARGVPPHAYAERAGHGAAGTDCMIHSPLPFAPPMDHLPEMESDVCSAGDLLDMKMAMPRTSGVPSDQENQQPDPVEAITKPASNHVQVTDSIAVDIDDNVTVKGTEDGPLGDQDDDKSSTSSERTVVPQPVPCETVTLASSLASFLKQTTPNKLCRQDSAVVFVPVHVDAENLPPDTVSHHEPGCREWAVVPCSELSENGLRDEFLSMRPRTS